MRSAACAIVAVLALAGCAAPAADTLRPAEAAATLPHLELTDAHDHADRAAHDVAWNLKLLGWDPVAPSVDAMGRYNQVVVHGGLAFVSAYALAKGKPGGLAILDVNADAPRVVGTLATPDVEPIDVAASPDGTHVFLAAHRDERARLPASAQTCTGTPGVNVCTPFVPAGVHMIDVTDPTAPRLVASHASLPSGAHTVKAAELSGRLYVFVASYGTYFANRLASHVEILRVDDGPGGKRLTSVGAFLAKRASGTQSGGPSVFVHDVWIEQHPVGKPLLYVSYWDGGVVIADLADPERPVEIADWRDFDPATYGNVHFARPLGVIGERHITMAAPEFTTAGHAGEAYLLDTTDPARPKLLTRWTLPGDPVNDFNYRFSPHNFDVRGTRVAYGHYHGGVWLLDVADPERPLVEGYVFPVSPVPTSSADDAPRVWNAMWTERGTLVVSDVGTGLYQYAVERDEPGTPPYEAALG